jgi:hypothetical protein
MQGRLQEKRSFAIISYYPEKAEIWKSGDNKSTGCGYWCLWFARVGRAGCAAVKEACSHRRGGFLPMFH